MTIYVTISKSSPNLESLRVVEERPKAYRVEDEKGRTCWLPKSGLAPRKPSDPSYSDEYVLRGWFRDKLNYQQEQVLGIAY